jgi:hypothetical protein
VAFVHGKNTVITLDGDSLSAFTNTSEIKRTADSHDVTCYGANSHAYSGGLKDGTASMGGIYDGTAAGPRDVIAPLLGTLVTLVRRPEGTGTGLAQDSCTVLVTGYTETNPVADMVSWQCDMQISGDVTTTDQ